MTKEGTESLTQPLVIVDQSISALRPFERNARTHSNRQIRQIAESIGAFGFVNPVLIDSTNRIIAGHGRVLAAKRIGRERVPTVRIDWLSEDQIRAYIIADNQLALKAGWDKEILAIELQYLMNIDSPDFDVTITGFEVPEIDAILADPNGASNDEESFAEPDRDAVPATAPGDIWHLGKHRITCASCLHESTYRAFIGPKRAAAVFTDPPFNVRIDGHATGNGAIRHREFTMASGEMSDAEFFSFLTNAIDLVARFSAANAIAYFCMDWRHVADLVRAAMQSYDQFTNLCVWVKDNGGMGSFYRSQHELIGVFRKGKGPHRNNIQLGQFGRNRTNVWQYPGVQTMSKQGGEGNLLALHPTVKPVAMVADAILDSTARNEIVLDSFLGSGTTLMAAERVGRICFGIEIDPAYVDVAIRRWQNYTGESAVHAMTGKRFDEIVESMEGAHA
jgi:DNA modification methylase